jgi:hypothetical protein
MIVKIKAIIYEIDLTEYQIASRTGGLSSTRGIYFS